MSLGSSPPLIREAAPLCLAPNPRILSALAAKAGEKDRRSRGPYPLFAWDLGSQPTADSCFFCEILVKKKRLQSGPVSYRSLAKLPRGAGHKCQVQHARNLNKEPGTMKKYRVGYNTMWKVCPRLMQTCNMGRPGTFDKHNHHGGQMPGWPHESAMTNNKASRTRLHKE